MATPLPEDRKQVKIVVKQPKEMTEIEMNPSNPKKKSDNNKKSKKKGQRPPKEIEGMKIIKPK